MASMTLEDLSSHLKKIDFCMFSTNAGSGRISSRPMSNNGDVEYDGDSWFFSYEDSRKIAEIEGMENVSLTFTAPPSLLGKPGIFIAINGVAALVRDKSAFEKHWVADLKRWFPNGTDTPGIVLIKVSAVSIHYWDGEENGESPSPVPAPARCDAAANAARFDLRAKGRRGELFSSQCFPRSALAAGFIR